MLPIGARLLIGFLELVVSLLYLLRLGLHGFSQFSEAAEAEADNEAHNQRAQVICKQFAFQRRHRR